MNTKIKPVERRKRLRDMEYQIIRSINAVTPIGYPQQIENIQKGWFFRLRCEFAGIHEDWLFRDVCERLRQLLAQKDWEMRQLAGNGEAYLQRLDEGDRLIRSCF